MWRLQRRDCLYQLWWLLSQGRNGLVLHRDGELSHATSFTSSETVSLRQKP
jgi:hypothetical protein